MSKEELKKLQARNRELQANLRELYTTAAKEKRELNTQKIRILLAAIDKGSLTKAGQALGYSLCPFPPKRKC